MLRGLLIGVGLIVLVIIVAGAVNAVAFNTSIRSDAARAVAAARSAGTIVTEERIARLPPPVQRYLRWSGVVGKPIPAVVRVTQTGRIRGAPSDAWMDLEADETYTTDPPALIWHAFFPKRGLPVVFGRDEYLDGKGSVVMRLLGAIPVAEARSDALAPAGLMRYLNEMMWFPAAFAGDNVSWRAIDDTSAEVTLSDRGMSAIAVMTFDAEGRPVNFRAERYSTTTAKNEIWETPLSAYGTIAGLNLPTKGSAVWKLTDGDFSYIELTITGVTYEAKAP
jgi:hypothetical protein